MDVLTLIPRDCSDEFETFKCSKIIVQRRKFWIFEEEEEFSDIYSIRVRKYDKYKPKIMLTITFDNGERTQLDTISRLDIHGDYRFII